MEMTSFQSMVGGIHELFIERQSSYSRLLLSNVALQNAYCFTTKSKVMNKKVRSNKQSKELSMPIIHQNAAGIDVGDMLLSVAVPAGRDGVNVKEFNSFTKDLHAIAKWLKQCDIETVAMECTGVYWKNIYTVLIGYGFEVCLVNARHTRNVSGRKTDEKDAQWIQRLHTCGLLNSSFLPDDLTQTLRTLVRQRRSLMQDSTRYVLRLQKAMEMMNIKLHAVISNITGKTGSAIVEAIIAGERNPEDFLPFVHKGIKADKETLLKSLQANWRSEQLFLLQQCWRMYQFIQQEIRGCEQQIESTLQNIVAINNDVPVASAASLSHKQPAKNKLNFDARTYLHPILGVDITNIYGISEIAALEIFAETGADLSKWPTENHFVSWLNLCPNNKISGGKLISSQMLKKKPNAASQAFRYAANGLQRSDHWLGNYFRRMKAKGGNKYAIVATARKLAIIYYKMVRFKQPFLPFDNEQYKLKCQRAKIAYLERVLNRLKSEAA
jgi:transposase